MAGQPRDRVQRMIDRMERRNQITARQAEAGRRFHDDWEIIQGASDRPPFWMPASSPMLEPSEVRLDAATRHRLSVQRIGLRLEQLVNAVVIDDRTVEDFAGDPKRVPRLMGQLEIALDEIGDVYQLPG